MRDWNTPPPSGAFPAPAEGLPPCILGLSIHDGRIAGWSSCQMVSEHTSEYRLQRGSDAPLCYKVHHVAVSHSGAYGYLWHGVDIPKPLERVFLVETDDPDEAKAAFERGAEYVRTGEGP